MIMRVIGDIEGCYGMLGRVLSFMILVMSFAACGGPRLPHVITSEDGTLSAGYPDQWVARADTDRILLATSQVVLDNPRSIPSGEMVIAIGLIPDSMVAEVRTTTQMTLNTPLVILNVFGARITGIDQDFTSVLGIVSETRISDRAAARAHMTFTSEIGAGEGTIYVIDQGNDIYVVVIGSTLSGEMSGREATLLSVARSVTYQAVQGAPAG